MVYSVIPGAPTRENLGEWVMRNLRLIEQELSAHASIADGYVIVDADTFVPLRSFNTSTVTTQELARVFATFIMDMKRRGETRVEP